MMYLSRFLLWTVSYVLASSGLAAASSIYAALGDSYASGDGAGSSRLLPNLDPFCGRFSDAYPVQIANDTHARVGKLRNLACGGAVTTSVLKTQVPFVGDSDVVTLQVGGNEVDFFLLLNECVYQWRPLSSCEAELIRARTLVQSQTFLSHFDTLIAQAVARIRENAFFMVLGYARFFNDRSDQCDHVSFSHTDSNNMLIKDIRRQLNDIVNLLNEVIKASADAHGVRYVNIDKRFDGHRFCEDGAVEPARTLSWFFGDAKDSSKSRLVNGLEKMSQYFLTNPFKDFLDFTRTFHPTSEGHTAIAKEVLSQLKL